MKPRLSSATRVLRGFTLIEVLVVLAIGALLITMVAGFMRSTRHSAATVNAHADDALALQLAAELLREELRLAGAQTWPPLDVPGIDDVAAWLAPALVVATVGAGHSLRLRFLDHRLAGAPLPRDLTFEVAVDASGESQLYRRAAGAARQPFVGGVTALRLVATVDVNGSLSPWSGQPPSEPTMAALVLELSAAELVRNVVIELPNRPKLAL